MRWLHSWRSFSEEEKRLFLEAMAAVIVLRVSLWVFPFRRILRTVKNMQHRQFGRFRSTITPLNIGKMVSRTARRIPRASCLTQALATQILLARRGHTSLLRFGAKQSAGKFEAHAWVESAGETVVGKRPPEEFSDFKPLVERLPNQDEC